MGFINQLITGGPHNCGILPFKASSYWGTPHDFSDTRCNPPPPFVEGQPQGKRSGHFWLSETRRKNCAELMYLNLEKFAEDLKVNLNFKDLRLCFIMCLTRKVKGYQKATPPTTKDIRPDY